MFNMKPVISTSSTLGNIQVFPSSLSALYLIAFDWVIRIHSSARLCNYCNHSNSVCAHTCTQKHIESSTPSFPSVAITAHSFDISRDTCVQQKQQLITVNILEHKHHRIKALSVDYH